MVASLSHRGPDGSGVEASDGVVLGHRRLAILDLSSDGAQPMWDASRRYRISYNGEIYNWRELRAEATRRGSDFRSETDTEVILNLFALDGMRSFSRLKGMFAFCLHDSTSGTSYLVRDRAGIKPLYYRYTEDGMYFASELGAMLSSGAARFELDRRSIQAFLRLDYVPTPWSIISGVGKLDAGTILECSGGRVSFHRMEECLEEAPSAGSYEQQFESLIEQVVARQLVADVPVGILLSGGIDSTIIAATAARLAGRIQTFSIGFEQETFDERTYAREIAATIGSMHHEHVIPEDELIGSVEILPSICSEPIADGSILPTYALSRFVRRHVMVALSGDGADELFGGYPLYQIGLAGRVSSSLPSALIGAARKALRLWPVRFENLTPRYKASRFLRGLHDNALLRHHRWLGTFLEEELPALLLNHDPRSDRELDALLIDAVRGRSGVDALMRSDARFYLQDQVLVKTDRASMASSLEVRVPFLDEKMVAFARALPMKEKVTAFRSKILLRKFVERRFSSRISQRPKKGFGAPLGAWFRGPLRELLHDTLSPAAVRRAGFFSPEIVAMLLSRHARGVEDHRKELFNLLSFMLWFEHWKKVVPESSR